METHCKNGKVCRRVGRSRHPPGINILRVAGTFVEDMRSIECSSSCFVGFQQVALVLNAASTSTTSLQHKQLERVKIADGHNRSRTSSFGSKSSITQRTVGGDLMTTDDENRLRHQISSPFARQDIFYSGSVTNLQEYKASPDMATYVKVIFYGKVR